MLANLSDAALAHVWRPIMYAYYYTDENGADLLTDDDLNRMLLICAASCESAEHIAELQVFNSDQFGAVRTTEIDGKPWFCLSDVCKPLELQTTPVKNRLKASGVTTINTADSLGRPNRLLFINEPNLYRAIFQSKKPEAELFTDWVTEEVLPALRRTGSYAAPQAAPDVSPGGLASLINVTRRVLMDLGGTPQDVGYAVKSIFQTFRVPVPTSLEKQIPGQLSLFDQRPPALEP